MRFAHADFLLISRRHCSPGESYECWSINYTRADGVAVGPMAQSCGAEDYAWTAEATTVSLIHQVIGFREQPPMAFVEGAEEEQAVFMLRPALPSAWLRNPSSVGDRYSVLDLHFRGVTFAVHYTVAFPQEARAHATSATDDTADGNEGAVLRVQVVEGSSAAGASEAKVHDEFAMRNADQQARVIVRDGRIVDIVL